MSLRKKLIEVALPLEAINVASAREKSIRHGHPSTLHLWWARRPLAAARAVIFAQMVDDPGSCPEEFPTEKEQEAERQRLFCLIEELVQWENTTNEEVLQSARNEIWRSWRRACADNADHPQAAELFNPEVLPAFHDPFAGGGALPLEAQRLGLVSHASDLNPVAVLINKAMIEIPPKFTGRPPVHPEAREGKELFNREWKGAQGLAEDVRIYGQWMREEAKKRIGHLYPKVRVTEEMATERPDLKDMVGQELTIIAWIWARTVKSPNPAFAEVDVPLASTFFLSTKAGKEAYVEPVIEGKGYRFVVKTGLPKDLNRAKKGTKLARGANFSCLMSETPLTGEYIKKEGIEGRFGSRLMAIVAEGNRNRVYLSPTEDHEETANKIKPYWIPDTPLANDPRNLWTPAYGLTKYGDLFTPRQLVALNTFSDLVGEARALIEKDAIRSGQSDDRIPLRDGGIGALAYAEAVGVYLGFGVSRLSDRCSTICSWDSGYVKVRNTFGRQAIPMTWDYAEGNPFCHSTGNFYSMIEWIYKFIESAPSSLFCHVSQENASHQLVSKNKIVSTDPPYYDNIGYADLSDYFYVWMRKTQKKIFPGLFSTVAVPKSEELVATPYRHGNKAKAEFFFLEGMTRAMNCIADQAHSKYPVTIYYAFKQSESDVNNEISSTGWETFLDAVISAGFGISGTWPMRTELGNRMIGRDTNALASSIVLVCRKKQPDLPLSTKKEFIASLNREMPVALRLLQEGNTAPVDMAQASIGPGMAIYTRYAKVMDAQGQPVSVREALALINEVLDNTLSEQEGDFDSDTRFALAWFEQHGFEEGSFGEAEVLAKAKVTSIRGLVEAGILASSRGKVRLLMPTELPDDWDPQGDKRLTVWECVHHLVKLLNKSETNAAELVARLGPMADVARELAYQLYSVSERSKRAQDALAYNALVQSWPEILRLSQAKPGTGAAQGQLFD